MFHPGWADALVFCYTASAASVDPDLDPAFLPQRVEVAKETKGYIQAVSLLFLFVPFTPAASTDLSDPQYHRKCGRHVRFRTW
jgi:hypothetical protein